MGLTRLAHHGVSDGKPQSPKIGTYHILINQSYGLEYRSSDRRQAERVSLGFLIGIVSMAQKVSKQVRLSKKDKIKATMDKLARMWEFQAFIKDCTKEKK